MLAEVLFGIFIVVFFLYFIVVSSVQFSSDMVCLQSFFVFVLLIF